MDICFHPIGVVHSCYQERFGVPRQPGMVPTAWAQIELFPPYDQDEAVRGLEDFSHIWVIFHFHSKNQEGWRPTVRPPRLGGNRRIGVFASRSPFRPNPLGISAVRLLDIKRDRGRLILFISGIDLLDGTPVLDIKPYVPYSDAHSDAAEAYAPVPENSVNVEFNAKAIQACGDYQAQGYTMLELLIRETLAWDPRPAYQSSKPNKTQFGMRLWDFELKWEIEGKKLIVISIDKL